MTVQYPLYADSAGNLHRMTLAHIVQWRKKAIYEYSLAPGTELTVVSSSGANMSAITDTRLQSGTAVTHASSYQSAPAPSATTDVSFDKINQAYNSSTAQTSWYGGGRYHTTDTGKTFPIYSDDDGHIHAMNIDDLLDTFIHPAIDLMVVADASADDSNVAGTYRIHTASSLSDFTEVSGAGTAIFTDNTSTGFSASSIGTSGSTQTGSANKVQDYFLMRRDGTDVTPDVNPLYIKDNGDLQSFDIHNAAALFGNWLKNETANSTKGYKITYTIGAGVSGTQRGTSILNKQLGSNVESSTLAAADDYRTQRFPSGSATTTNTYIFTIAKS